MSASTPAVNRVPVARQTFRAPVAEVYAALVQTLHFSAGFDVVANDDVTHSVRFRLPNDNGEYEARVIADGMHSAVIIEAPAGTAGGSAAYSRLYRELAEQIVAQSTVVPHDVIAKRRFRQAIVADNDGPRSKWAIGAVVFACGALLGALAMFSDLRPDWQVCVTLIVSLFVVCGIAFAVTGRNGKVSGRNQELIAFAISCLASVLLLCATIVVQIRYSTTLAISETMAQTASALPLEMPKQQ